MNLFPSNFSDSDAIAMFKYQLENGNRDNLLRIMSDFNVHIRKADMNGNERPPIPMTFSDLKSEWPTPKPYSSRSSRRDRRRGKAKRDDQEVFDDNPVHSKCVEIDPNYMTTVQTFIDDSDRRDIIDYMIYCTERLRLTEECLYFAVIILDKFSSCKNISNDEYKLIASAALFISAKIILEEDDYAPEARDFVYTSGKKFIKEQLLDMEREILKTIDYSINTINMNDNIYYHLMRDGVITECEKELGRKALKDYNLLAYTPSDIARAIKYICDKDTVDTDTINDRIIQILKA